MLLARLNDTKLAFAQHDHGLLSGAFAQHWRPTSGRLSARAVRAIALHDYAWRLADLKPAWDTAREEPVDFIGVDNAFREPLYRQGIDDLEAIDLFTAYLVSLHYGAFGPKTLTAHESKRRARIGPLLELSDDSPDVKHTITWLRFLDIVSLYACMRVPGVREETLPAWLDRGTQKDPDGRHLNLRWVEPWSLAVPKACCDPFSFELPLWRLNQKGKPADSFWTSPSERVTLQIVHLKE